MEVPLSPGRQGLLHNFVSFRFSKPILFSISMAPDLVERIKLKPAPGSLATGSNGLRSNKDLRPVPFKSGKKIDLAIAFGLLIR